MYRTFMVVLVAISVTGCGHQNVAPAKVAASPSVCGFPGVEFPADTVVLGAGELGGREIDFQIEKKTGNPATQIDVSVNYPNKPVALMMGASNPTIWNIGWTEETNIVAVFVSGYHRQQIAGLKTATPRLISTHDDEGPCNTSEFIYKNFIHSHSSGFIASFNFGLIKDPAQARDEQKLSQILFSQSVSKIFPVNEKKGKVLIGSPLESGQELVTSFATPPDSFFEREAPLAGQAALDQAVKKGILRRATLDDAAIWTSLLKRKYDLQKRKPPNIPPDLNNAYVILEKFTYPPGLTGNNSATFYIAEGAPPPKGDYGHSKVYDLNSISLGCTMDSACGQAMQRGEIGAGSTQQMMTIGR